jgi:undecaprenyl-diphosphatase
LNYFESILLGLIQGIAEFLPISSSGHLVLAQSMMKSFEQPGLLFDTLLHFATLCAVFIFFRKKIKTLFVALSGIFIHSNRIVYFENKNFLWGIIIASIPTAIIGLTLENVVETKLSYPVYVGYALIITSIILMISDKFQGKSKITLPIAFLIGIVQGFAVVPGISRSGSTIAAALFLGIKREEAAEFSFLISLPAILGATILQLRKLDGFDMTQLPIYGAGMLAAFISGIIAIAVMMQIVKKASLKVFAIYCLIIGIVAIVWI